MPANKMIILARMLATVGIRHVVNKTQAAQLTTTLTIVETMKVFIHRQVLLPRIPERVYQPFPPQLG